MDKKILDLLYKSLDHTLSTTEQGKLDQALKTLKDAQLEKKQLLKLRQGIADSKVKSFKPFFADKVMRNISSINNESSMQEDFFNSLFNAFRPIAITATIILIVMMSYNIIRSDNMSLANALAEPEISLEYVFDPVMPLTLE